MSLGTVLDEAWTIYTRFFMRFFLIGLAVFVVVNVVYALLLETIDEGSTGGAAVATMAAVVATIIGSMWLQAALVHAVVDARDGTLDISVGDAFRRAWPFILPLLLSSIVAGLGILLGIILLVIPGLILAVRWSVIAPAIVLEQRGVRSALGRSNQLVKGSGWTVFALVVITGVLAGIAGSLLRAAFAAFPPFVEVALGGTIADAVVAPFSAIALTIAFLRLREAADGPQVVASPVDP